MIDEQKEQYKTRRSEYVCTPSGAFFWFLLIQKLLNLRKRREGAGEDAVDLCDGNAIICDGNAGGFRAFNPGLHFPLIQHARAAMDHKLEIPWVIRKFSAGGEEKFRLGFGIAANPFRELFCADIAALTVVRAAF